MTEAPGASTVVVSVRRWSACTARVRSMATSSAARTLRIEPGQRGVELGCRHPDGVGPHAVEPRAVFQRRHRPRVGDILDDRADRGHHRVDVDTAAG